MAAASTAGDALRPTVRLGVTRNLHALVSPKRRPTQTHYEVDTFMVERMTLRIPVAACAEAQHKATTAAEATPAARLLAGLPALAKQAKPDALTSVPLTAKDPNERQVLQPVELPLAAFLQAVDAPAKAHTVVDGADALNQRDDGWMANVMRVATNPPTTPLRAPKVSPRKKKTSPRRRKKKGKDKAPTQKEPAPASSTAPLVVRHPSPLPARPTLPPVDTVSKAAYRCLEAENGRLRRALAQARERRTPPTTPPPPRRDHGVQTDAPAAPTTPQPPTVVVIETPCAALDEAEAAAEASLAERIVRKERLEARRQVRALLGCGDDEDEADEGEENTMVDSESVSDTASDASSTTPPPTPPPPVPPPPVPPPPVPPPPVPPPPLAPPPLLLGTTSKQDGLAALTPTLPLIAAAA